MDIPLRVCARRFAVVGVAGVLALGLGGCSARPAGDQKSGQPQSAPAPTALEASAAWTRDEALARLRAAKDDAAVAVAATVRLVRIAGLHAACVPDPLPRELAARLAVVEPYPGNWILGVRQFEPDGIIAKADVVDGGTRVVTLWAPVRINEDGDAQRLADGFAHEVSRAYVSEDAQLFPHVVVTPSAVAMLTDVGLQDGLTGDELHGAAFVLGRRDGFVVATLVLPGSRDEDAGGWPVVAEYRWDFYEQMFLGPAAVALSSSSEPIARLALDESPKLVPVGGVLAKPKPTLGVPEPSLMEEDEIRFYPPPVDRPPDPW